MTPTLGLSTDSSGEEWILNGPLVELCLPQVLSPPLRSRVHQRQRRCFVHLALEPLLRALQACEWKEVCAGKKCVDGAVRAKRERNRCMRLRSILKFNRLCFNGFNGWTYPFCSFFFLQKKCPFFQSKKIKTFFFSLKNFSTHDGASSFIYDAIQA